MECIGKGKAHRPYEFGVKVSVATTAHRSKGGQFVTHVAALPSNPYDGHTLATVIPAMEDMIGNTIERLLADAGYRGHNAPPDYKFRVYTSGQKRRLTPQIKRELRRRAAIEPVIGHLACCVPASSIIGIIGRPIVSFEFETQEEAEAAHKAMQAIVAKAKLITPYADR